MYLCCVSLIQNATVRGVVPAVLGLRLIGVGLLAALAPIGAGLSPVTFATLLLAVLVTLVALEVWCNLRSDSHPSQKAPSE